MSPYDAIVIGSGSGQAGLFLAVRLARSAPEDRAWLLVSVMQPDQMQDLS